MYKEDDYVADEEADYDGNNDDADDGHGADDDLVASGLPVDDFDGSDTS